MAKKTNAKKPDEEQKVYQPERFNSTIMSYRSGPIPVDECKVTSTRERPGQLRINNKGKDSKEQQRAGSLELLEYFFRLSKEEHKNETINLTYVKAILSSGADINFSDSYGQTVMHAAARDWNTDVVRFLLDNGATVDKPDAYGRTPLFIAAILDYPAMIRFLVEKGANINRRTYGEKQTPFHYAVRGNAIGSIRALVKLGADIAAKDYKGRCPLFVAAENGVPEAALYLLEIGCPAAVYNSRGYSAMALMVEKMPSVAMTALSQFLSLNEIAEEKRYHLAPLEWNPYDPNADKDMKTTLEVIVKYREMDLLLHPVIQRLIRAKNDLYAKPYLLTYLFINIVYILLWCILGYLMSSEAEPFHWSTDNLWKNILAMTVLFLTLASAFEQIFLGRAVQASENNWKLYRLESLREDIRYCHPQWPNEKEVVEVQIERYSSMVGDYYKNFWTYLEWMIFASALSWNIACVMDSFGPERKGVHQALRILITIVIMLVWIRFLKACRIFKFAGEYIAIIVNVVYALGQFAFLFFLFFVPLNVAFWVFFGGKENGQIIKESYPRLANAFVNLNDVVYSVWTLTLVVGFPTVAIQKIDMFASELFICLYYLLMSVVLLNLFIALMSNLFARVHKDAKKYASLEQAKIIILCDRFVSKKKTQVYRDYMQKHCNPLVEPIKFRETMTETEPIGVTMQKVKIHTRELEDRIPSKGGAQPIYNREAIVNEIKYNLNLIDTDLLTMEQQNTSVHKIHVENKRIMKILGVGR